MPNHSFSQLALPVRSRGFSLIEVLVTMLLISLALLGTSGLQAYALKLNQGGQFRTQAVVLASDLSERMEANKAAAVAGNYVYTCPSAATVASSACGPTGAACSPSALATYDLLQWQATVASTLPQSTCSVVQTIPGNPSTYTITLAWVDRQTDTTYNAAAVSSSGTGEVLTYQASRTIFN
jgi:type IV pilus assembly protein PilV